MTNPPWKPEQQSQPPYQPLFQPQSWQTGYAPPQQTQWQQPTPPQRAWPPQAQFYPSTQYQLQPYQPAMSSPQTTPQKPGKRNHHWLIISIAALALILVAALFLFGHIRIVVGGNAYGGTTGDTSQTNQQAIIGTWTLTGGSGAIESSYTGTTVCQILPEPSHQIEFTSNNQIVFSGLTLTYTFLSDQQIEFGANGEGFSFDFSLSGNTLTLTSTQNPDNQYCTFQQG